MSWQGRGSVVVRQWRLLTLLRRGRPTITRIASELGVSVRTVRRDLDALQAVPFPIASDGYIASGVEARWWLETMDEWPRQAVAPIRELRV